MRRYGRFLPSLSLITAFVWLLLCAVAFSEEMPAAAINYDAYYTGDANTLFPNGEILLPGDTISNAGETCAYVEPGDLSGVKNALVLNSTSGIADWVFTVDAPGWYQLEITYLALPARQNDIEMQMKLDGSFPFEQCESLLLRRLYNAEGPIARDSRGHDVRPKLKEVSLWQSVLFQDHNNHYGDPYRFYLSQGEHTLSLGVTAEALAIQKLRFVNMPPLEPYENTIPEALSNARNVTVKFEAEEAGLRNSPVLYPLSERADAATSPSDPVKVRMNTIGGENWKRQGEWMEWAFTVPEDGLYQLSMRVLTNFLRGMGSTRRLYIDGKVPFAQADHVTVPYKTDWQMYTLADGQGNLMPLYLKSGTHTLRLEVAAGPYSEPTRKLEEVITELGAIYRKIIVITGDNADGDRITIDLNRDFHLDKKIPGLMEDFAKIAKELKDQQQVIEQNAFGGSEAAMLTQVAVQLENFVKYPEDIPQRLESFKNNISGLASQILRLREQPMQIDYFTLTSADLPLPKADVGFFNQAAFRLKAFVGSFFEDYSAIGEKYNDVKAAPTITVWVCANDLGATGIASGRDQTQVIKELIDQNFVKDSGIQVNLSLIDGSGTLMQAILGGKGPDVAITVYKELPVNLAMRGALADLSRFDGFEEITSRFMASALVPYAYQGGVYALPETQNFDVIFYRKDIFEELGLTVPDTWEDFRAMVPVIQKQGMQVGVPSPTVTNNNTLGFQAQLFQRGLSFYTGDLMKTQFQDPKALEAFKAWTDLYLKYALPVKYDFFSRFRTGTMPIAIESYTTANTLAAAAPELNGLWDIAPIPGIRQPDGTVDRSEGATGTGTILIATSREQEAAFKFISWWVSDETQAEFGQALESLMGASARWPTANIGAFERMKWTVSQQAALKEQWKYVKDIPQLPGNYITNRYLAFAFRAVIYLKQNQREVLNQYNKEIDKEIKRKWAEFGYGQEEGGQAP
jgi:ABC-type glycerol-3-phosphate transport system substrate-binding protein